MPISYDTHDSVTKVLTELLEDPQYNEFNSLRGNDITFKAVAKSKLNKDDELVPSGGPPAEAKKISGLHQVFIKAHYILVVDLYEWREADMTRQKAIIHRALMAIKAEVNSSGEVKLGSRKPDVAEFITTISRFGATTPEMVSIAQTLQSTAKENVGKILTAAGKLELEVDTSPPQEVDAEEEDEDEADAPVVKRSTKPTKKVKLVTVREENTIAEVQLSKKEKSGGKKKPKGDENADEEPPSSVPEDDDDDDEDKLRTKPVKRRTTPLVYSED